MEKWLTRQWYDEGSGATFLQPLAWLYRAILCARQLMYRSGWLKSYRLERPVIVVGNITVGGTGKTPLVAWIAQLLTAQGFRVAIVSRGYGANASIPRAVTQGADWRQFGDEPVLLAHRTGCPVFVCADRVAAAREAIAAGAEVIISDDGLQHLRLQRDVEIAVIDGARGLGNGRLLPAGPLREDRRRLRSVDLIVINGVADSRLLTEIASTHGPAPQTMHLVAGAAVPVAGSGAACPLGVFRGRHVHAVAGIGNPERFFRMLRDLGIQTIDHPFPDHHPFSKADLAFADDLPILMTEKDAVRCTGFADQRMWYVPVTAELSDCVGRQLLDRLVSGQHAAARPKR